LTTPAPRRLVITHGLSGCGKTHTTSAWLQNDPLASTIRLRSDVERKRLFGLTNTAHSVSEPGEGIYSAEANSQTYARLGDLAQMLLVAGGTVLVDAAFLKRAERDAFRALAQQYNASFEILAPQATNEQLMERIQTRNTLGRDASDATLDVLAQQMRTLEPLEADELAAISKFSCQNLSTPK
jgi:predicted kinase